MNANEKQRRWRNRHRDEVAEKAHARYLRLADGLKEYQRGYYKANREKCLQKVRECVLKRTEKERRMIYERNITNFGESETAGV